MKVTITLNGVTLNPNIKWPDKWASQAVAQEVTETLAGNLVVFAQGLPAGRKITLVADDEQGWLDKATVEALDALAKQPGAVFTMAVTPEGGPTTNYSVVFRHDEAPAFDARAFVSRLVEDTGDYFAAVIKLRTV